MSEQNAQIKKVVSQLIAVLNSRNREIISRRFGLKTGRKETLESIGQSHKITRERVRQIEEASLAQIRNNALASVQPFADLAKEILESHGGVANERDLFEKFSGSSQDSAVNAALVFALTLQGNLHRSPEDDDFHTFWALSSDHADQFQARVADFIGTLEKPKQIASDAVASYLSVSKNIGKNVFGEIGLNSWAEIRPRGVRDKSYLVLKKEGKPRHFRDITGLINETGFGNRKAHVQTVHNELIKDDRFVLVGRGIYGLAEWGYEPGTVKQVIANLLRKEGAQSKDKIIAHVMSSRMVKSNTVVLGMQDKNLFRENENGHIVLKEA